MVSSAQLPTHLSVPWFMMWLRCPLGFNTLTHLPTQPDTAAAGWDPNRHRHRHSSVDAV